MNFLLSFVRTLHSHFTRDMVIVINAQILYTSVRLFEPPLFNSETQTSLFL